MASDWLLITDEIMDYINEYGDLMTSPIIGQKIPDFELEAYANGKVSKVRLRENKSKWMVLLFYPADFTFICPTELQAAGELYPQFKKEGAEVMSVSTDTVFVHKAWHDNSPAIGKIKFPMIADPTGKLCRSLGTYIEEEGLSLRATFIIDPEGVIRAMEVHDNSIGRNIDEILRKLQAAKFVREHRTEVCPVNWKPGGKTLKPGLNLVGKM
ncbi:MAG: Peroxiredoxin [Candidatus Wolfebacteria bacterium GW2011_GWC2_39_22]|uniref:Peroxiredoxin n=1 Tax=Candidatus Wolfebacteria bacterium GW2011_GWC2_39_22 TaxID=1619013 RepID=A0A0G0N623_9BACT|nr:MAG: Peroxiredoxin [Candidatus Wolfebacteria bacterium GW2011_GWC2_39_22]